MLQACTIKPSKRLPISMQIVSVHVFLILVYNCLPITASAQTVTADDKSAPTTLERLAEDYSAVDAVETQPNTEPTALDEYVQTEDDSYSWEVVAKRELPSGTSYTIDLKSQTWLTPQEVDRTLWQHWLMVFKPKGVTADTALMFISGGANGKEAPQSVEEDLIKTAVATESVVAEIKMIPNQPLVFHGDGVKRYEDDLIGYTWDQFLQTGDKRWPARLPMVKAVVRGMDTVQALLAEDSEAPLQIEKFTVAGASKRGWTTWMTAAVDERVAAIAPIVIDVLNVDVSMRHHYAAYGFWAPAVGDYVKHRIMQRRDSPRYRELIQLVDPFAYRERLTMPKCIINASGDQFFCPDSSQYYFDQLPGENHLCYVPNADHSLRDSNAIESLIAFHFSVVHDVQRPSLSWGITEDNQLRVSSSQKPVEVVLWSAYNPDTRDFRVDTIGKAYERLQVESVGENQYAAELPAPVEGWQASFVQCAFDIGAPTPLRISTSVKVLPDELPYLSKPIPTE